MRKLSNGYLSSSLIDWYDVKEAKVASLALHQRTIRSFRQHFVAMCLRYEGCNFLRQRLVLATLSQKSIVISDIRADEEAPGLKGTFSN